MNSIAPPRSLPASDDATAGQVARDCARAGP